MWESFEISQVFRPADNLVTESDVAQRKKHYVAIDFIIGVGNLGGSYLSPKLRFDEDDLGTDTEDKVVAKAIQLIRDNFAAARRLERLQGD